MSAAMVALLACVGVGLVAVWCALVGGAVALYASQPLLALLLGVTALAMVGAGVAVAAIVRTT